MKLVKIADPLKIGEIADPVNLVKIADTVKLIQSNNLYFRMFASILLTCVMFNHSIENSEQIELLKSNQ